VSSLEKEKEKEKENIPPNPPGGILNPSASSSAAETSKPKPKKTPAQIRYELGKNPDWVPGE
jgi:hypothetical protein